MLLELLDIPVSHGRLAERSVECAPLSGATDCRHLSRTACGVKRLFAQDVRALTNSDMAAELQSGEHSRGSQVERALLHDVRKEKKRKRRPNGSCWV